MHCKFGKTKVVSPISAAKVLLKSPSFHYINLKVFSLLFPDSWVLKLIWNSSCSCYVFSICNMIIYVMLIPRLRLSISSPKENFSTFKCFSPFLIFPTCHEKMALRLLSDCLLSNRLFSNWRFPNHSFFSAFLQDCSLCWDCWNGIWHLHLTRPCLVALGRVLFWVNNYMSEFQIKVLSCT